MKRKRKRAAPAETLAIHNPHALQMAQMVQDQQAPRAQDDTARHAFQPRQAFRRLHPPMEGLCSCGRMGFMACSPVMFRRCPVWAWLHPFIISHVFLRFSNQAKIAGGPGRHVFARPAVSAEQGSGPACMTRAVGIL